MGAVFRPKDLFSGRKKIVEEAVKDLSPPAKEDVIKIFRSWEGAGSEEKLKELLGQDKTRQLLKKIKRRKSSR